MPIKIKVTPDAFSAEELAEQGQEEPKHPQISLNARQTLDGKIMIMDHRDIDIIVDTTGKKIITFPKNSMSDEVYQTQNKYFHYLAEAGIINRDSVHAGNVFASMQGTYPDTNDSVSAAQVVLLSTYKFIQEEKPRFEQEEWLDKEMDDWYAYPTPEDSTSLGEVPEKPSKGTVGPYSRYGYTSTYEE